MHSTVLKITTLICGSDTTVTETRLSLNETRLFPGESVVIIRTSLLAAQYLLKGNAISAGHNIIQNGVDGTVSCVLKRD